MSRTEENKTNSMKEFGIVEAVKSAIAETTNEEPKPPVRIINYEHSTKRIEVIDEGHHYRVGGIDIKFQKGPREEFGINGIFTEDLIEIAMDRIEVFQNSNFRCRENSKALDFLENALLWLLRRISNRRKRNVFGRSIP